MTTNDRIMVLRALWRSVRMAQRLPRGEATMALDELQDAIECMYNAHGDVRATEAYENGQRSAHAAIDAARDQGHREGMLALQKRADYRDPFETRDPEELRSVH
jgi:hypothetical protein